MKNLLEVLEFSKIKNLILNFNINELSKEKLEELEPLYFYEIINEEISKTKEGYELANLGTFPHLTLLKSLTYYLDVLAKNGVLTLEQIYEFVNTLEIINAIKDFISNNKLPLTSFSYTLNYIHALTPLNNLLDQIKFCVTPNFTLFDHASSKLKEIREKIRRLEGEIREKLNQFLRKNSSLLSDSFIAQRGSHLVLPVKASFKNQVKGIVIDVSDSGNTLFIEPSFVSESNIALEQLRYDEDLEIARIIKGLCLLIYKNSETILLNQNILKELSFMLLKGTFGLEMGYEVSNLVDDNEVSIIGGYHPLINKDKVIPNDFYLGGDNKNIIVISGPNAGGKTVALKTVGLIILMNQCGLPLPIKRATLGVFRSIFVDIGDEQSIEESLSGFSSHMKNVAEIVNAIDSHSFLILDELGSKTDPNEGEALAKAIIEYISESKAIAMVTTHYIGIKDYANSKDEITLASMGFDELTLNPTYKLLLNVVGRSYALEISSSLGLKDSIIAKAKAYKNESANKLDKIIDELSISLKDEQAKLATITLKEKEIEENLKEINEEKAKIAKEYEKSLAKIQLEKEEMLEKANEEIQAIVNEFKGGVNENGFKHHLKNQALDKLNSLEEKNEEVESKNVLNVGDDVKIISIGKIGKVKEIKGNKVVIESDRNTITLKSSDVIKINIPKANPKVVKTRVFNELAKSIPLSCNLIGMHVDEAEIALKNYLDACIMAHLKNVTIIHGYGSGALRKATHQYLKNCKYVSEFRLGGYNEGGAGATVVTLK